jgi:hypothetical protein
MTKRCIAAGLLGSMLLGCRWAQEPSSNRPRHALIDNLQPPPLNRPIKSTPIPVDAPAFHGTRTGAVVTIDGRVFEGTATLKGRARAAPGRLEFTGSDKQTIQVVYRSPAELPAPLGFDGEAELRLTEQSSPDGPERTVLLRAEGSLLFAHAAVKAIDPVSVELQEGWRLFQSQVSPAPRLLVAPVALRVGGMTVAISPLKPTPIVVGARTFTAFVEASRWAWAGPKDQHAGGYILEAWIVRTK